MRPIHRLAYLALLALALPGCSVLVWLGSLDDPLIWPTRDVVLTCTVTVRNPDVVNEAGEHPEVTLSSRTPPAEKLYYEAGDCDLGTGNGFESVEAAEEDWSRFARRSVASSEDEPGSIFAAFPGEWCAVQGTLRCVESETPVTECTPTPATPGAPLATCPPPLQLTVPIDLPDPCLAIQCDGDTACSAIDFSTVPLGATVRRSVTFGNCGEVDAPVVEIRIDRTVYPVGERADFEVLAPEDAGAASCLDAPPDEPDRPLAPGEACRFTVEFAPQDPREHSGEILFTSTSQPVAHRIALAGFGQGGSLRFTLAGLEVPAVLCDQELVDGACTAPRTLEVQNDGPGAVRIDGIEIVDLDGDGVAHSLIAPPATPFWLGSGEAAGFGYQWCSPDNPDLRGRSALQVRSNDPDRPAFTVELRQLDPSEDPCPPGS